MIQQSLPKGAPEWVARCEVPRRKGGDITHGTINDAETLRWLAQQNCVTPHVWNARCDRRDKPDRLVFDLDPTGGRLRRDPPRRRWPWRSCSADVGLVPFAKLQRLARIHVVAPLKRTRDADEVRAAVGRRWPTAWRPSIPDTLTTEWRKEKRDGKILVDVARNTLRADGRRAYAVRALAGAPDLGAADLGRGRGPRPCPPHAFTLRTHRRQRLEAVGDPWHDIGARRRKTLQQGLGRKLDIVAARQLERGLRYPG